MKKYRASLAALELQIAAIERRDFLRDHKHKWRYTKHLTHGSVSPLWVWTCTDEKCGESRSTNTRSHLPADFPEELR